MIKKEALLILIIFLIAIYGCTAPVIDDSKDAQEKVKQTGVQDQTSE